MDAVSPQAGRPHAAERRRFLKRAARAGAALAATGLGHGVGRAQASPAIVRFDHVAVPMRNTAAMVAFYAIWASTSWRATDLLGPLRRQQDQLPPAADLGERCVHAPAPRAVPPCGDFCFVWGRSAAELEETLARVGAEVIEGPVARQGRAQRRRRHRHEPLHPRSDGILLEFIIY